MTDLAGIRNAARDVAKDMVRFDRDFARFQRLSREHLDAGGNVRDITRAVNEACAGHPEMVKQMQRLADGLTKGRER